MKPRDLQSGERGIGSDIGKISPIREAALVVEKTGVGLEAFYAEWLKLVMPEDREIVARAANLDREYTAFVRRTGDAVEWLLDNQATTNEPIDSSESNIVQEASRTFRVTPKAIERAFEGNQSKQVKYLKTRGIAIKPSV
jgi:hypothetical protein